MITLTGGAFQDAVGTPLSGGRLVLQLSTDAQQTVTNPDGQVISGLPISLTLDAEGNIPSTQIWSNEELAPVGTYYTVRLFSSSGQHVWAKPQTWVFSQSTGQSLDIGTITPGSATTPSYPGAIVRAPALEQMIIGGFGLHNDGGFYGAFHGPLEGDVTGDVTGDLTGNVTGNLTGNVTGNVTGSLTGNVTGNVTGDAGGNLTAATATANTLNTKAPVANVKAFGAVGDGVADDSVAINAAIASGAKDIYLPAGTYKCDSSIDLAEKIGLTFRGDGEHQDYPCTSILGNTGSVVLDLLGSSNCKLRGFHIRVASTYTTPSKVAILQGRSGGDAQFQYSQFNKYEGVMVYMDSIPAATIRGTVGIYNVGAEHTDYEDVYVIADEPLAMAATDVLSVPSPNAGAHGGPTSMTLCHFKNCGFRAWTNYGCEFWAAENITFDNCYSSRQAGSTAVYPLVFNSGCHQIKWRGQLEEWPAVASFSGGAENMEFDLFSVGPTQTLIAFGASLMLSSSIIRIRQNGTARSLFQGPAGSVIRGCLVHTATTAGINDANITVTGGIIVTDDPTSDVVTVNAASRTTVLKNDGKLGLAGFTGTTVGAAGAASAMPTPVAYLTVNVGGTDRKIALFNV
jgi:hypothetical protein